MARCKASMQESLVPCLEHNIAVVSDSQRVNVGTGAQERGESHRQLSMPHLP